MKEIETHKKPQLCNFSDFFSLKKKNSMSRNVQTSSINQNILRIYHAMKLQSVAVNFLLTVIRTGEEQIKIIASRNKASCFNYFSILNQQIQFQMF